MVRLVVLVLFVWPCVVLAGEVTVLKTAGELFGSKVAYLAEAGQDGVLVLNANNGFFDKGAFRAAGKTAVPEADRALISSHFKHLVAGSGSDGAARWYVWLPKAGSLEVSLYLKAGRSGGGSWLVGVDGDETRVRARAGDERTPQAALTFRIREAGRHVVSLRRADGKGRSPVDVFGLVLRGEAAESGSLLRARWRPAAVHTQYHSSTCPTTKLWVFESQNVSDASSYSPMTTRFGYFGGGFDADGRASGGINFSMWAASRNAGAAPPVDQMPHLLATGNPNAEFGGFGHEGSGVKIRNWEPYAHHPKSIIQALRVETADGYDTYSGYLFDERVDRWVLYAVGRRPVDETRRSREEETVLRAASFCEVPGPPDVERTGDRRRTMRRRGWFADDAGRWHAVDRQTVAIAAKDVPVNKFVGGDDDGWFVMGTGGMEMLDGQTEVRLNGVVSKLPSYLEQDKVRELFELPVAIGESRVERASGGGATVVYELDRLAAGAKAELHFGSKDCVTFVSRALHGTERRGVSEEMLSADRTWARTTGPVSVVNGENRFELAELRPGTTYFYRVLVTDDDGKCWAMTSGQFVAR